VRNGDPAATASFLNSPEHRLGDGVVGVADAADRGREAFEGKGLGEPNRGVLADPASE
jgi:hypothetical protein